MTLNREAVLTVLKKRLATAEAAHKKHWKDRRKRHIKRLRKDLKDALANQNAPAPPPEKWSNIAMIRKEILILELSSEELITIDKRRCGFLTFL